MRCPSLPSLFSFPPSVEGDPWQYERFLHAHGVGTVAGVDEAGRGPLAGPVVAACVVLSDQDPYIPYQDSKALTAGQRDQLYGDLLHSSAIFGIGIADPRDIEQYNIHQASLRAMRSAVKVCQEKLASEEIGFLLVDGKFEVPFPVPQKPLVKGESKSCSIAAASIVAKVTRDRMMASFHEQYPHYNFIHNQGYPTREHREAIRRYGITPLHRRTFKGVREHCREKMSLQSPEQNRLW